MNFDMFSNGLNEDMDPNYIYPRPYLDPMMYINPYTMNGPAYSQMHDMNNMNPYSYMTYMNPYMNYPMMDSPMCDDDYDDEVEFDDDYDDFDYDHKQHINPHMMHGMPMMNQNMHMMPPMPMMNPHLMQMMMNQNANMMNKIQMPMNCMPNMYMIPFMQMMMNGSSSQINMEEFDEEEM